MKTSIKQTLETVHADAGLWIVYNAAGRQVGAIYDRGCAICNERAREFDALDCWESVVPGRLVGTGKSFKGAMAILRRWIARGRPTVKTLPNYHPDYKEPEPPLLQQLKKFVEDIANNSRDAIWQEEWFLLRARASGLYQKWIK